MSRQFASTCVFTRCSFFRSAIFHELNSQKQALTAHVANKIVLCFRRSSPASQLFAIVRCLAAPNELRRSGHGVAQFPSHIKEVP
jgi:hypothetical protein